MSWDQVYPNLSDITSEIVDPLFEDPYFMRVTEKINLQGDLPVVSFSLYLDRFLIGPWHLNTPLWKIDEVLKSGSPKYADWNDHLKTILSFKDKSIECGVEAIPRVYLARNLRSLIPSLEDAGCEIFLMADVGEESSLCYLWNILALEDGDRGVTLAGNESLESILAAVQITAAVAISSNSSWRIPLQESVTNSISYRSIRSGFCGCTVPIDVLSLLIDWRRALCSKRNELHSIYWGDVDRKVVIEEGWPNRDAIEWFLTVGLFPCLSEVGLVTLIRRDFRSALLPLDIEFATWINQNCELIYVPESTHLGFEQRVINRYRAKVESVSPSRMNIVPSEENRPNALGIVLIDRNQGIDHYASRATRLTISSILRSEPRAFALIFKESTTPTFFKSNERVIEIKTRFPCLTLNEQVRFLEEILTVEELDNVNWVLISNSSSFWRNGIFDAFIKDDSTSPCPVDLIYDRYYLKEENLDRDWSPRVNSGLEGNWAVRRTSIPIIIDWSRTLIKNYDNEESSMNFWKLLFSSVPLSKRCFDINEIYAPYENEVNWHHITDARIITLAHWDEIMRMRFMECLNLGLHPKNDHGKLSNLVDM